MFFLVLLFIILPQQRVTKQTLNLNWNSHHCVSIQCVLETGDIFPSLRVLAGLDPLLRKHKPVNDQCVASLLQQIIGTDQTHSKDWY